MEKISHDLILVPRQKAKKTRYGIQRTPLRPSFYALLPLQIYILSTITTQTQMVVICGTFLLCTNKKRVNLSVTSSTSFTLYGLLNSKGSNFYYETTLLSRKFFFNNNLLNFTKKIFFLNNNLLNFTNFFLNTNLT